MFSRFLHTRRKIPTIHWRTTTCTNCSMDMDTPWPGIERSQCLGTAERTLMGPMQQYDWSKLYHHRLRWSHWCRRGLLRDDHVGQCCLWLIRNMPISILACKTKGNASQQYRTNSPRTHINNNRRFNGRLNEWVHGIGWFPRSLLCHVVKICHAD